MNKRFTAAFIALLLISAPVLAQQPGSNDSAKRARVAGNTIVERAASAQSNAEWAKRRPDYQALKPQVRPGR